MEMEKGLLARSYTVAVRLLTITSGQKVFTVIRKVCFGGMCSGELDRIRSGYYPKFFYPKIGKLAETFIPKFEQSYYIHSALT